MGSHLQELLKETVYRFLPSTLVSLFAGYSFQVLKDLEPRSDFLSTLREATHRKIGNAGGLKARTIVHASEERVVETTDFIMEDPTPILIEGKTHTAICKPNQTYTSPLEILKEVL
jgi:hypothetical protein